MSRRILVACIGNIFLGDDGFGVEVAKRLAERELPEGVEVVDFGIRGLDLVYTLLDESGVVIMVDALPAGEKPGTLSVIEPHVEEEEGVTLDTHGMDPAKVLAFAQALGAEPARTLVVGCEPETVIDSEDHQNMTMELSQPVRGAVEEAVKLVESLVEELGEVESGAEPGKGKGGESV